MNSRLDQGGAVMVPDILLGIVLVAGLATIAAGVGSPATGAGISAIAALLLLWRAVGSHAAVRRVAEEAELVAHVFQASQSVLSTLDVNQVLRTATEAAARLSSHTGGAILFLTDEARPVFRASWGVEQPSLSDPKLVALEPHLNEVLRTRRTVIVPLPRNGRGAPGTEHFRAACLLPMRTKTGMVGVLGMLTEKAPSAFHPEVPTLEYFAAQAATAIDNARLYQQVQDLFLSTIKSLAAAVDAKDAYTHGHSEDIAELVAMIAREMKLPPREEEKVRLAGLLHDIGKIGIPDAILRKPGKLDPSERAIMMTHVTVGASIIDRPGPLRDLVAIVRHHHEHYDGRGYPDGLRGNAIPIGAAILSVADAFDAMTSHRAYHAARESDAAIEELKRYAGTQFHPEVVEALVQVIERERQTGTAWYRALEARIHDPRAAQPSVTQEQGLVADEIDLAWHLGQAAREADDLRHVAERIVRGTVEALRCGAGALLVLDGDQALRVEAAIGLLEPGMVVPRTRSVVWQALEQRAAQREEDGTLVCAPLVSGGRALGVLQASGSGFGQAAMRLVARLADTVAPVVHTALLRTQAERGASTDELTGLLNRRALVERLREEARRHKRYGTRFAVALADIQGLAEFNAAHGFAAGDELMRRLGEIITPGIRQTDYLARVDGGTFAMLMPEIDQDQAGQAVQRMQELLAERDVVVRGQFIPLPPLIWALAACPADGTDPDALLALAERRLHVAQQRAAH